MVLDKVNLCLKVGPTNTLTYYYFSYFFRIFSVKGCFHIIIVWYCKGIIDRVHGNILKEMNELEFLFKEWKYNVQCKMIIFNI